MGVTILDQLRGVSSEQHSRMRWVAVCLLAMLVRQTDGASALFSAPPPPPPDINMFANCDNGCRRMIITRADYRECEPVRLRLVPKPDCVEESQQVTLPPCLEDDGCLALYCPETTDWPMVCPVAEHLDTGKNASGSVTFNITGELRGIRSEASDWAVGMLGQCPRRRHFGFYSVEPMWSLKSGAGGTTGFPFDIRTPDYFTEKCQGHTVPSCTLRSYDFGEDLYIYGQYTDTYELLHPRMKDVNGELMRYRWLDVDYDIRARPKNKIGFQFEEIDVLVSFNYTDAYILNVPEGYRGGAQYAMDDSRINQLTLPQWVDGDATSQSFKCGLEGIRAVNVSFSQNIAGSFTGCCILEVHLLDFAMMRRKVCATFGESDDAAIVSFVVSGFGINEMFDLSRGAQIFAISVASTNVAIQIFAETSSQFAEINLNYIGFKTAMISGEPTAPLGLGKKGTTRAWTVEVTAENGDRMDYSVDVTREE